MLGPLEKGLRAAAELGAWQLISPRNAVGRVLVVDGLHEIQDEVGFPAPLLLLCATCSPLPFTRAHVRSSDLCLRRAVGCVRLPGV